MPVRDSILFVDTNIYLDLYKTNHGKELLASLTEQAPNLFVTQQVVWEFERNKLDVMRAYLSATFKAKLESFGVPIPDHLFGTDGTKSQDILAEMKRISDSIQKVKKEIDALAVEIMDRLSKSEDDVSTALKPIFAKAVPPSKDEIERARLRKERGSPPGKFTDPLGDQISWEQILTQFSKGKKRLWIITRDGDYGTEYQDKVYPNRFLHDELRKVAKGAEFFMFDNVIDGIKHFADATGADAEELPSPEVVEEIKKERRERLTAVMAEAINRSMAAIMPPEFSMAYGIAQQIYHGSRIAEPSFSMAADPTDAMPTINKAPSIPLPTITKAPHVPLPTVQKAPNEPGPTIKKEKPPEPPQDKK